MFLVNVKDVLCEVSIWSTHFLVQTVRIEPSKFNAPINVNPVGGECGQGVGIWQILKFFDQIPQGGRRKVNQSVKKAPTPREKSEQTML